ncbi:hypothetical protein FB45DRAFT_444914 [Roridomyces roridus]|uniref:NmrA-like domain-containing protein n=1 Tax=Roridomyces roridus TaxID=1738132 RepID=A0AAD7C0Z1_9AGAR|nr:hypothetical protein FB45DRAFT_444914 [Roridomyces roridus]
MNTHCSMSPRIVSVFGATGIQGAAVIDRLIADGTFVPRAITRNTDSDAARALKTRGVHVITADPLDKASLGDALHGCEALFMVTNPMLPTEPEGPNEVTQGKNIADVAKEVGVKFIVFTSLPSITDISGGKYPNCFQYDLKPVIESHIRTTGIPHAFLHLGAFLENFWKFNFLAKTPAGFDIAVPNQKPGDLQAFTWVEREVPAATLAILKRYLDEGDVGVSGKTYPIVNATISFAELAERTGRALGVEVTFTAAPAKGPVFWDEMWAALGEYSGLYTHTPVPNPELVALGVQFGTIEEFLEKEVKPRFGFN